MVLLVYLIFLIIPPFGLIYAVTELCNHPKKWRQCIPFLVFTIFIGAYVYYPTSVFFDLVRYIPTIEEFGKLSLYEAIHKIDDVLFARDLLFWFFGRIHLPHMVPAVTTATVYSVAFYITCDTAERYHAEQYIPMMIAFQAAMLPYINLINNIRNVFAFSLIILAVYLDIIKKKRNLFVFFCYGFGTLMHLSAFAFVVFRLLCRPMKKMFLFVVVLPFAFPTLTVFLYRHRGIIPMRGNLGISIRWMIGKLYFYLTDQTSSYALRSMNSITVRFDRLVMVIGMLMALILILYALMSSSKIKLSVNDANIFSFAGMIASLTLASNVFIMPNFWRFAAAFYVVSGAVMIPYILQRNKISNVLQLAYPVYALLGFFSLLMQFYKCSWFDFWGWIRDCLTTNIFTLLIDIFKGIVVGS